MRCVSCRGPAVIEVRRHHSAFCRECFARSVRGQVERAIRHFDMLTPGDRALVAVSGGKDSLALWDLLLDLGYEATGLSLGLGIGDYSSRSSEVTRAFARERGADLLEVDLARDYGFDVATAAYAFLRGIDYVVEECPLVAGNTQLRYKEAMNQIERTSPGTKAGFFLGFLDRGAPLFGAEDDAVLRICERCDQPTPGRFCAFCRARAQILGEGLTSPDDREVSRELADEVLPAEIYDRAGA